MAPSVLTTDGSVRRAEHERDYDSDPTAYQSGTRKFDFDRDTYAHRTVKAALILMQREKCAFCEAKPLHVADGDVEHFRPKAAVRQSDAAAMQYPGYYWLAYEWENLLFACERCNRRHKRNAFPLADDSVRTRTHHHAPGAEAPLFVDPASEDPEMHIGFREHVPIAIGGSSRGEQTIKHLGLGRKQLNQDREERLNLLRVLYDASVHPDVPEEIRERARAQVAKATAPDAEYSLMCRLALAEWDR